MTYSSQNPVPKRLRRPPRSSGGQRRLDNRPPADTPARLVDTTMLYAPKSGGVKRYLSGQAGLVRRTAARRPPHPAGPRRPRPAGTRAASPPSPRRRLPFGDGYRWCSSVRRWSDRLVQFRPDLIEVGDPYGPGHAALDAGERLGVPVVGFCHSDPAALAKLHLGEWAEPTVRRRWARLYRRFDQVVAPSRHIAERLNDAGVPEVNGAALGVDTDLFHPGRADRSGPAPDARPFSRHAPAGLRRPAGAREEYRRDPRGGRTARRAYHLVLIGAGAQSKPQPNASFLDYRKDPQEVARLIASCDAFVHANAQEPFGLVVLEAMACGLPMVGVGSGGVAELVDHEVGQLAAHPTPAALAEAIDALFQRDFSALSLAARERAVRRHGDGTPPSRACPSSMPSSAARLPGRPRSSPAGADRGSRR